EVRVGTTNFIAFSGKATLRIGDFVEIELAGSVNPDGFTGTARIFVGQGPSKLDDGSPNPNAVGVLFDNADFSFVKAANGKYAIPVSGTGSLVGVPGITLSAALSIQFNDTGVTQTLNGVDVAPDATKQVSANNVEFTVAGLSLMGSFEVTFDATGRVSG